MLLPPSCGLRPAVLMIALGLLAALGPGCSRPGPPPEPVRVARTLVVAPAAASRTVEYAAEIRARTEVRLGFRVAGKLQSRAVEVGQRVRPGQVLAQLDAGDLNLSQQAAASAVRAAEVGHALATAELRRFKELRDQGFISGAELDRRDTALQSAAAQLAQARAQADLQASQSRHAVLSADAAGIVVAVEAEPGAVLGAGAPVLRVALDGPRDAVFVVPEDAVGALRALLGRPGALRVRLWAGGDELPASVREIAAAADPATRTFLVKAQLAAAPPAPHGPSSPQTQLGQTATVVLAAPQAPESIRLPLAALREHRGQSAVWIVDPASQAVSLRPVAVTGADGNEVLVSGGLKPGERVVTAGVHVLSEGQKVRVQVDPRQAPGGPASASAPRSASASATAAAAR